ncbi:uncharacterized protein LOC130784905 [Actinidia eriantha]|uniref:uncharacterized protein LOC130784905 n=1 Tax=Actinidia eriantha TaxID=165200 RepID=UPI002588F059|nr:uncharacterized protein LOC130784905 [Actinidia eriantha]
MVGIEGIVVGNVGREVAGRGGRVTLGKAGMVGNVGILGKEDGIWVLGSGGNVGFGRAGIVGNGGGSIAVGRVGMAGSGGRVWSRWRAAKLVWLDDGGERKGIAGIVVGIDGREVAGSGGRVTFGTTGMVGNVGILGKEDGIWVLGSGGNVGFGRVGIVGNGAGSIAVGRVGMAGSGGRVTLGSVGIGDIVWSRWRAAKLVWLLERESSTRRDRITKLLVKAAIV